MLELVLKPDSNAEKPLVFVPVPGPKLLLTKKAAKAAYSSKHL